MVPTYRKAGVKIVPEVGLAKRKLRKLANKGPAKVPAAMVAF
jgi:hypothetical protein